ncbi:esterase/lipase family protein [Agromyces marinus]|uniref:Alpha/beta hydrolase n=1 Tax=Agromyces marinus TaxID=1389020 RepID=A0ABN6YBT6_9MICO|nr:alpha/beta hydrolase [Agromyces marinus]UIP57279.1 hypothetical protein DSM26151_01340 [Agromyces marinus]BDZ54626.1 hypothetical protein GCM10025870_16990 [Agromyces marinus]
MPRAGGFDRGSTPRGPNPRGATPPGATRSALARLGSWALDYLYAGLRQLAIVAEGWNPPRSWSAGRRDLPELVLLPGIYEHWSFLRPIGDALNEAGYRVRVVHGLGSNRRGIASTAGRLGRVLARTPAPPEGRIVVAHSKGGLVAKHVLVAGEADATAGLLGLVAVCTPFGGSSMAGLVLDPSVRALLPTDETIVMLGRATSANARIVSVFGDFDPHIPDGSVLDGATNIRVPVAGHFRILGARETHLAVLDGVRTLHAAPRDEPTA